MPKRRGKERALHFTWARMPQLTERLSFPPPSSSAESSSDYWKAMILPWHISNFHTISNFFWRQITLGDTEIEFIYYHFPICLKIFTSWGNFSSATSVLLRTYTHIILLKDIIWYNSSMKGNVKHSWQSSHFALTVLTTFCKNHQYTAELHGIHIQAVKT